MGGTVGTPVEHYDRLHSRIVAWETVLVDDIRPNDVILGFRSRPKFELDEIFIVRSCVQLEDGKLEITFRTVWCADRSRPDGMLSVPFVPGRNELTRALTESQMFDA